MLSNDNEDTLNLDAACKKDDLIKELKARGADTYKKVQSKESKNYGLPASGVTIDDLKALLRAANGGNPIVVRDSSSDYVPAASCWARRT